MEFKHPKYYAALRAERRKLQAASLKPQAASFKLRRFFGGSPKLQAASYKLHDP